MPQLRIARHAEHCGIEIMYPAMHPLQERRQLELANAYLEPGPGELGLEQLLQRGFARSDGEEFE